MINPEKQIAYVVMEAVSDPAPVYNLREYSKNGMLYVKFDTVLQSFNVQNRNKRTYDADAVMESLQAPHIQELIRKKTWCSEFGHPTSKDIERIVTILPEQVCGRINSFYRQGNLLNGEFETFDDGGYGTMLTRRILQGMEPAYSLRMLASLTKNRDGSALVKSKGHVVTFDNVILPSHMEAYRNESQTIEKVFKPITESSIILPEDISMEEHVFAVNESMIMDFVKEESKNVKLVSNVMEVLTDTISMTPDLKNIILKEGNETYYIKTEEKIKHDIRSFMKKF